MPFSFTAPSARWFAHNDEPKDPTPNAGLIVFDGQRGCNSVSILGKDHVQVVGRGFIAAGRIYVHFGDRNNPKHGEWLFFRVKQEGNRLFLRSPILDNHFVVLQTSGEYLERIFPNAYIFREQDGTFVFHYRTPANDDVVIYKAHPMDWLTEHVAPILINVEIINDFALITYSPRNEGDDFPMEDFLYSVVINKNTGQFLGHALRREYHAMSARFDTYIDVGQGYGPVNELDWWPVFYQETWAMTLKTTRQPIWDFSEKSITVTYHSGHASQRFSIE